MTAVLDPETFTPIPGEPEWVFPFPFMRLGDSFFLPTLYPAKMAQIVESAAAKDRVRVRVIRRVEDQVHGVRVWRIG